MRLPCWRSLGSLFDSYLIVYLVEGVSLRERLVNANFDRRTRYPGVPRDTIDGGELGAFQEPAGEITALKPTPVKVACRDVLFVAAAVAPAGESSTPGPSRGARRTR